jgi:hypothetical protein
MVWTCQRMGEAGFSKQIMIWKEKGEKADLNLVGWMNFVEIGWNWDWRER